MANNEIEPDDLMSITKNTKGLTNRLKDATRASSSDLGLGMADVANISAKSQLPKIKRSDYERVTGLSGKDVPSFMQNYLSENGLDLRDSSWAETFPQFVQDGEGGAFVGTPDDILGEYERLLDGTANGNEIFTKDNIRNALGIDENLNNDVTQSLLDEFGNKRNIDIAGGSAPAQKVAVRGGSREPIVAETTNPNLAEDIQNMRYAIGTSNGGSNIGGNGGVNTTAPDYGGLGDSGFDVRLKDGKDIDIKLKQPLGKTEIKRNRAIRNLDDEWIKGLNATKKQYGEAVAKSKSAYNGYKTPAEMARLNGVSLDNINEIPQAVVDALERRKLNIEKYAEDRGVNVRLDNLDLTNIEPATKATMKMQGIDPDKISNTGAASPLEAETLYKDLRNRAMKTTDGDRAVAYNTMADYVRNQIDNTMDNLNIDFSAEMSEALGESLGQNADRAYLRGIATNKDLKFSDLRREQADWIKVKNLSGNPMKKEPTVNIFGVDTGVPNPVTKGAEKIKEKFYERQAYGAGGGNGASGAENTINFETTDTPRNSVLSNILGKKSGLAKNAALIGGGAILGSMLNGGGQNQDQTYNTAMGYTDVAEQNLDPYETYTLGGYTYSDYEQGLANAISAGNAAAAETISSLMEILANRIERMQPAKNSGSSTALRAVQQLEQLYNAIGNGAGVINGRLTYLGNKITGGGLNPTAANYESMKNGMLGVILKKGLSESGALSDADIQRAMALLPGLDTDPRAARGQFNQLYQLLQTIANE